MKIIHIISSLDKGGAETYLAMLCKYQIEKNKVVVIYLKGNGYWAKKLSKLGITVIFINFKKVYNISQFILSFYKIKKIIKNHRPDIVHAHLRLPELILFLIKLFNKKFKMIITKHLDSFFMEGSGDKSSFFKGIFFDRIIFKYADHIIFISKYTKSYFLKKIITNKKKVSVIRYGFNDKFYLKSKNYSSRLLNKIKKKNKEIIICNIARHVKQKSINVLLDSIAFLKTKYDITFKLILVGNGPENKNLRLYARELKINQYIIWIKYYENVKDIYDLSDFFVLTSNYEGLGLVLLEAMNSSVPIIANNASSIPEVVKNDVNGYLINKNNPRKFAEKIHDLVSNKKKYNKIKLKSKKFLFKKFNYKKMCELTDHI